MHALALAALELLADGGDSGFVPTPTPTPTVDPDLVTPGPAGFLVIVLLVVATVLLAMDMLRRVRRARYREEVREALDAEEAAARDAESDQTA